MSLYPIIWAVEHAPIVDAEERAILVALVTKGDFDGCNCYRSFATLARVARVDRRTAMRKVQAMTDRGVLREQTDPKPKSWYDLPADKRPVVREAMIPASFWSKVQLAEINEQRATRSRAPISGTNRPDLADAPPKKARADKGKPNPKRSKKKPGERGVSQTPVPEQRGVSNSHLAECLEDTSRGVSESPNPLMGPSDIPSSSSAEVEDITDVVTTEPKRKIDKDRQRAEQLVGEKLAAHDTTPDERHAVVDHVILEAERNGKPVNFLARYIEGRPLVMLERNLAEVRKYSVPPTTIHCDIHDATMTAGTCVPCAGEAKAGDAEDIAKLQAHLDAVGADVRPDLMGLLADRQKAAAGRATGFTWEEQLRAERRARNGVRGGSRMSIPDHTYWKNVTDEDLRKML